LKHRLVWGLAANAATAKSNSGPQNEKKKKEKMQMGTQNAAHKIKHKKTAYRRWAKRRKTKPRAGRRPEPYD